MCSSLQLKCRFRAALPRTLGLSQDTLLSRLPSQAPLPCNFVVSFIELTHHESRRRKQKQLEPQLQRADDMTMESACLLWSVHLKDSLITGLPVAVCRCAVDRINHSNACVSQLPIRFLIINIAKISYCKDKSLDIAECSIGASYVLRGARLALLLFCC